MIVLPNRPYLAVFALCCAGVVMSALGLIGVGVVAYLPAYARLGYGLIVTALFAGPIVAGAVMARHIATEYDWLDEAERNRQDAQAVTVAERVAALEQALDVAPPSPEPVRRAGMTAAMVTFFVGGDKAGSYSQPKLARVIPSSDKWQELTDWYCAQPEGDPVLVRVAGRVGTRRAFRWTLERVLTALAAGDLPLPPGPPPTVNAWTGESKAAEKSENSAGAVVEGVIVGEKG